jgi:hypothetical protein
MFPPELTRAVGEATHILTEISSAGHGWKIGTAPPSPLPGGSPGRLGMTFPLGANETTPEKLKWLQERGWIIQGFTDRIVRAPLAFVHPPEHCYHVTPRRTFRGSCTRSGS